MVKTTVKQIDNFTYTIIDENNHEYKLNIEFYDIKSNPKVGDVLYFHEKLLKNIGYMLLSLGSISGIYGRNITSSEDEDIVILIENGEKIYLKRYYG